MQHKRANFTGEALTCIIHFAVIQTKAEYETVVHNNKDKIRRHTHIITL
jgi:hypothetical protein